MKKKKVSRAITNRRQAIVNNYIAAVKDEEAGKLKFSSSISELKKCC